MGRRRSRSGARWPGSPSDHGVRRIAFELHPLYLVYNVPTLERMRSAVGPVIGANVDPSHMFWQQMDPIAVIRALGPAVHHVHLKDTELVPEQVAIAGVLDQRPFEDPAGRAWGFRTVGRGHDAGFWAAFVAALREAATMTSCRSRTRTSGSRPRKASARRRHSCGR